MPNARRKACARAVEIAPRAADGAGYARERRRKRNHGRIAAGLCTRYGRYIWPRERNGLRTLPNGRSLRHLRPSGARHLPLPGVCQTLL